jgi:hypothetical protein
VHTQAFACRIGTSAATPRQTRPHRALSRIARDANPGGDTVRFSLIQVASLKERAAHSPAFSTQVRTPFAARFHIALNATLHFNGQVLASLLPGVRQLRAPLACGYLWLLSAWLLLADQIPRPGNAGGGILGDVYEIATVGGRSVILGAITFAAYLIGVLSVHVASLTPALRGIPRGGGTRDGSARSAAKPSGAGRVALRDAVLGQLTQRVATDEDLKTQLEHTGTYCGVTRDIDDREVRRGLLDVRYDVNYYVEDLEQDLSNMPLRLLADDEKRDVHGEFDRWRAEAEFRAAVVLPLIALVVVLAVRSSLWWLLTVAIPVLLSLEARQSARAAADILAEYVRACPSQSAALDKVREGPLRERKGWEDYAARPEYPGALTHQASNLEDRGDTEALAEAERLYRSAAELGHPEAMMWLAGRLHLRGDPEAEIWYDRAGKAGDPVAMEIMEQMNGLTPQELADLKAAYAGEAVAMMRVGHFFEGKCDRQRCRDWYRKAFMAKEPGAGAALARALRAEGRAEAADQVEHEDVSTG